MTGTEETKRTQWILRWTACFVAGIAISLWSAPAADARVIDLEEEEITVDLETPEANYILSPSIPDYRLRAPVASFMDVLEGTLKERPF